MNWQSKVNGALEQGSFAHVHSNIWKHVENTANHSLFLEMIKFPTANQMG